MAKITEDQKLQMNILYKRLGTYTAVAREIGCAPSTVKRYIIEGFVEPEKVEQNRLVLDTLPELDLSIFGGKNFGDLCVLSDEEKIEVQDLWKELLM